MKSLFAIARRWSRILVVAGLVAMAIGALDPLEGSLVILPGTGLIALGALLGNSPHRMFLCGSFLLVAAGVGAMWGLSAIGGFGGTSGRSNWWALVLVPYLVGWIMGLVGAIQTLREGNAATRCLALGIAVAIGPAALAQGQQDFSAIQIKTAKVAPNFYTLEGSK